MLLESEPLPGLVRLTLNRPQARNALDAGLIDALREALARHAGRAATRVLLLGAAGSAFCAGADLAAMRREGRAPRVENLADTAALAALLAALRASPKPCIACVQGPAFGGGLGLVAACDLAIAADTAQFRLPEVRLGLVPALISPYVIEAIGVRQMRRYALSGETIDPARARELGLVHEVVAPASLESAALDLARAIAAGGPTALATAKTLIAAVAHRPTDRALIEHTMAVLADIRAGEEAQAGLAAALERRPPPWNP
ncbi:MAG: enoyl-CoA hydratase/isomerase family protein [Gammaproteobacteria bacterium]|nr:enoyl-CoA hydratase/isomerase family protein [Gammaproteobacteria bacterium]